MDEWEESAPGILFLSLSLFIPTAMDDPQKENERTRRGSFFASALRSDHGGLDKENREERNH